MAKPNCKHNKVIKKQLLYHYTYYYSGGLCIFNNIYAKYLIKKGMYKICRDNLGSCGDIVEVKLTNYAIELIQTNTLDTVFPDRIE